MITLTTLICMITLIILIKIPHKTINKAFWKRIQNAFSMCHRFTGPAP